MSDKIVGRPIRLQQRFLAEKPGLKVWQEQDSAASIQHEISKLKAKAMGLIKDESDVGWLRDGT